ncbi:hypothetical protein PG985_008662 [Apiospora marii]|uniref:uncharacterized protein n=1 Tax=Apiospora marii TaxID=335849 RepID=UPI00312DAFC7
MKLWAPAEKKWEDGRSWGRKLEERPVSGACNHGILCSAPAFAQLRKTNWWRYAHDGNRAANQACSERLEADCAEQPSSGGTGCMRATDIVIQSASFPGLQLLRLRDAKASSARERKGDDTSLLILDGFTKLDEDQLKTSGSFALTPILLFSKPKYRDRDLLLGSRLYQV